MAISREKKQSIVAQLVEVLGSSQLTVFANYEGLTVAQAQELRNRAKADGTVIKVVKNRLVKVAMSEIEHLKQTEVNDLKGQLLYAANPQDEVQSAKTLAEFAKEHPAIKLLGGIDKEGNLLGESTVKQLAELPGMDELRAKLVGTMAAPLSGLANALNANLSGLVNVLKAREQALE